MFAIIMVPAHISPSYLVYVQLLSLAVSTYMTMFLAVWTLNVTELTRLWHMGAIKSNGADVEPDFAQLGVRHSQQQCNSRIPGSYQCGEDGLMRGAGEVIDKLMERDLLH